MFDVHPLPLPFSHLRSTLSGESLPTHHTPNARSSTLDDPVVVKLYVNHAVLGDRLDRHAFEVDRHPALQLVGAHVEELDALSQSDVRVVVLVEDGEAVVLCVAVGRVGDGCQGGEVVHPVKGGLVGDGVDAAEEEVDVVRLAGAQAGGQLAADKMGDGRGGEVRLIAHRVELGVRLDVLGELYCRRGRTRS